MRPFIPETTITKNSINSKKREVDRIEVVAKLPKYRTKSRENITIDAVNMIQQHK
jgi:hypothetical protein